MVDSMQDSYGFIYHAFLSVEDDAWVATVDQFPSLSWVDDNEQDAIEGLVILVDQIMMEKETAVLV